MKVAVSVPDRVFEEAERVAKRLRVPRSQLYTRALAEFVKQNTAKSVRESLEQVYGGKEGAGPDAILTDLQARVLREKW